MSAFFKIENDVLAFYDGSQQEPIYGMPLKSLGDIRMEGDAPCSDWVMQLVGKDWCSLELLYKFASEVRILKLDSKIDWRATFQIVERKRYLDQANELRKAAKNTSDELLKTSTFEQLGEMIRFNAEDDYEVSQPVIDNIVDENLVRYNLI